MTYQLNELMGSKLRALYQRRKGRDLFDLWYVLHQNLVDPIQVLSNFNHYSKFDNQVISRANFEKNLLLKEQHKDFLQDISILLANGNNWGFNQAMQLVKECLISKLPGEPYQGVR